MAEKLTPRQVERAGRSALLNHITHQNEVIRELTRALSELHAVVFNERWYKGQNQRRPQLATAMQVSAALLAKHKE